MNGTAEGVNGVQSVQRAATLLEAIAGAPEPLTAPELAERCGLNRSTAWRILATLEDEGLVDRDPATNRYSIGYALTRLASAAGDSLPRRARPHLEELARHAGETVSLAVPRGLQLVYVDQVQAPHVMAADWLGRAVPLHATSTGKALLAFLPPEELEAALSQPLPSFTESTITDPVRLRAELDRVGKRGYAVSRGELETALWGASAPILERRNRPLAVVSVWGAEGRLRTRSRLDELGRAAASTASAIAA
ncbi:MAG TPA: IclR family transcriptional regulator [Thermoleophilaceae bacterium]|nr:IclR family transcriptional regulator [Thermoleophilaceae bacterium]